MFLFKCPLLTGSYLSSRKQYEPFTIKQNCHYYQLLQRCSSTSHHMVVMSLVKNIFHLSPIPKHLQFTWPSSFVARDVIYGSPFLLKMDASRKNFQQRLKKYLLRIPVSANRSDQTPASVNVLKHCIIIY